MVPRQEYEYLIRLKKIKEFSPTQAQKNHWLKRRIIFKKERPYPAMNSSKNWDLQIDSSVFKKLQKIPRGNAENILNLLIPDF